jgi:hypothetical protein
LVFLSRWHGEKLDSKARRQNLILHQQRRQKESAKRGGAGLAPSLPRSQGEPTELQQNSNRRPTERTPLVDGVLLWLSKPVNDVSAPLILLPH